MKLKEKTGRIWARVKARGLAVRGCVSRRLRPLADFAGAHAFPLQLALVMVYRLSLDFLYINCISSISGYEGYTTDIQPLYYGGTLLAVFLFSPFVVRLQEEKLPSARVTAFLCYIYFIPLTSYCGCHGASPALFVIGIAYWTVLLIFQFRIPVVHLARPAARHSRSAYLMLTVFSAAFVMFISWRYTGLRFTLDIVNVYGIRAEAAGYQMPALFSYMIAMMENILAIMLLYWLLRKKYFVVAGLIVVYLFLYSFAAHKSIFFFLVVLLAGYCLYRPWMVRWMGGLLTLASGGGYLWYALTGRYRFTYLLFVRCMYLVSQLGDQNMAYFRDHPLSLYRDSILNKIPGISPLYTTTLPRILGEFRGHIGENANNGLLGDLFANLPLLLGLFLLPLIVIICLRLLDASCHTLPERLIISTCVLYAFNFANASWSTILLTHGFLVTCLLFYFFPKEEKLIS